MTRAPKAPAFVTRGMACLLTRLPCVVLDQTAALANHLQEAAARVMILRVLLQVRGKFFDLLRKERDLDLGRAGVCFVLLRCVYYGFFLSDCEHMFYFFNSAILSMIRFSAGLIASIMKVPPWPAVIAFSISSVPPKSAAWISP